MFTTPQEYYVARNVKVIKAWAKLRDNGIKTREAEEQIGKEFEISNNTVSQIIYKIGYNHATEAKQKIKEELKQAENQGKNVSKALAKLVNYEGITSNVPN